MNENKTSLEQIVSESVKAAQMPDTELKCQVTESVETESDSISIEVRIVKASGPQPALNLRLLLRQLEEKTDVGAIDLFASPQPQLVIYGALGRQGYKILLHF